MKFDWNNHVVQEEARIPQYSVPDHQLSVTSYHSRPNLSHFESRMTFDCRGLNPRQSVRKRTYVGCVTFCILAKTATQTAGKLPAK